jgi:hypothetical protein
MEFSNSIVNVNSFYFHRGRSFKSFPRQIEVNNRRFTFNDGFQYLVNTGGHLVRLFDMTDGHTNYRLRQEDDTWMLVGTRPA